MRKVQMLYVLLFGVTIVGFAATHRSQLKVLLAKGLERGYPGIAMVVQSADGNSQSAAVGFADLEHKIPMREEDAFHMASINKTFTAAAALRLVDQDKLSLDATLSGMLGSKVERIPNAEQITIAQLLDHSSGIYPTNNDMDYLNTVIGTDADPERAWTPEELVALADKERKKPAGVPGAGHYYSDTNYVLLGMIIEKVSGVSFKQHITKTILEPLGMRSTYFYSDYLKAGATPPVKTVQGYLLATPELRELISVNSMFVKVPGHSRKDGELLNTTRAAERIDAAGGLVTTLPDLLKFASALFRGKLLAPDSQQFLFAAGKDMERQPAGTTRTRILQSIRKEYGVLLYKEGDGPGGVNTLMAYNPSKDEIYAGFTNIFGNFNEIDFLMDDVIGAL